MLYRLTFLLLLLGLTTLATEKDDFSLIVKNTFALTNDTNKVIDLLFLSSKYYEISHETAVKCANEALIVALQIEDKRGETEALFRIGDNYLFVNNLEKSLYYFRESIDKGKACSALYWIARSYRKIASIQYTKKNYSDAYTYERKAINIHISRKDSSNIAQCYNQFAVFMLQKHAIDSAFFYVQKAIEIEIKLNDKRALARCYRILAGVHLKTNNLEEAKNYLTQTLSLQKIYSNKSELIRTNNKFGELYIQEKKYDHAIRYLEESIRLSEEIKRLRGTPSLYKNIAFAKELSGDFKGAYKDYSRFSILSDSLQYKDEQIAIREIELENNLIQEQYAKLELEQQKEDQFISNSNRQKFSFFLIIALIGLVLLIINALKKKGLLIKISEKELEMKNQIIANDIKQEQFKAINEVTQNHEFTKEQIAKELHDELGGTLAAIKINLMQLKEDKTINSIINQLGEIASTSRQISHDLHPPLLSSQDFCEIIEDYLSHIFNNTDLALNTIIIPEEKINALDLNIQLTIYRIIQELCNNIKQHSQASKVSFQLLSHTNDISLIIEDNGVGFTINKETLKQNKGIQLIKEQLKIIDGELEIDSPEGVGCTIYVFIPTNNTSK